MLRYIARANERHDVRAKLYRAVVDLLRVQKVPDSAASAASAASAPPAPASD
jgi:hypothetical protein